MMEALKVRNMGEMATNNENRIMVGVGKTVGGEKLNTDDEILVKYEFDDFNETTFSENLDVAFSKLEKKDFTKFLDEQDELAINTDLYHSLNKKEALLGGCKLSKRTIDTTRVSILEMAKKQLIRQVKETIDELSEKTKL